MLIRKVLEFIPWLNSKERADLFTYLRDGSVCNADFLIPISLSAALATLGLLLNSTAIVIGAMLVAPLMTPLIAAGCALMRGNLEVFRSAAWTMCLGSALVFLMALFIGLLTPRDMLTLEMMARGKPNILDLFVAFAAGAAAAYAVARPKVVATLAGIAIAAALVPPLCTAGIAFSGQHMIIAKGAAILFITNLVAIVLGSGVMFRCMGIGGGPGHKLVSIWARRMLFVLIIAALGLIAPLGYRSADQIKEGELKPLSYPLSTKLSRLIQERIEREPNVDLMMAGRMDPDYEGRDVTIILTSKRAVQKSLKDDLKSIVKKFRGGDTKVKVIILQAGAWS